MKHKPSLFSLFLLLWFSSYGQNYYVAANADNGGNGTLMHPFNTFAPLNELLAANVSVDTVFLKRGDVFRDQISVGITSHFVITAYGTGLNPVISGADSVLNWTFNGTLWEANFSENITHFFVNNNEQILARYPDDGESFLTVDNGSTNNFLVDAALNSFSNTVLNQSQVGVHTAQWCWEKSPIASSTNQSITYLNPTLRVPTANYGYFLYDHLSFLSTAHEWKYDSLSNKIYYMPASGNPDNSVCEASVRPYGILLGQGVNDISISQITFEKQTVAGIAIESETNQQIRIDQCNFARQYRFGIDQQGKYNEISNCNFTEVDGLAIYLNGNCSNTQVHHNTFRNIGGFRNSGIGLEINLSAIKGAFVDSCHIHHNDIDSTGYCGISIDGTYNLIERNCVKNAMLLNNDGAALKSFGLTSQYNTFRNNFISKGDGNIAGTPNGSFITPAIYFDFSTNHCVISENTIFDRNNKGIFLNSGTNNNTVTANVVYGGNYLLDFNGSPIIPTAMNGMTVKNNVLFAKDPEAYLIRMVDNTGGFNHGTIDSNVYFQAYNSDHYAFIPPTTHWSFTSWQTNTFYDQHTQSSFVNWVYPERYDTLLMNQTDSIVFVSLGQHEFLDLDSNIVCQSIALQPFTSKILIKKTSLCSPSGSETQIDDSAITIYPNPFSSVARISTNKIMHNASLLLYNTIGQLVYERNFLTGQTIDLQAGDFSEGLYIVHVRFDNNAYAVKKIMITP